MKSITVELLGGLDLLTEAHLTNYNIIIEDNDKTDLVNILKKLKLNVIQRNSYILFNERFEIQPGVLVLINDADWELENKENCKLRSGDKISFISMVHGG